jgi:hypothetical protein
VVHLLSWPLKANQTARMTQGIGHWYYLLNRHNPSPLLLSLTIHILVYIEHWLLNGPNGRYVICIHGE